MVARFANNFQKFLMVYHSLQLPESFRKRIRKKWIRKKLKTLQEMKLKRASKLNKKIFKKTQKNRVTHKVRDFQDDCLEFKNVCFLVSSQRFSASINFFVCLLNHELTHKKTIFKAKDLICPIERVRE